MSALPVFDENAHPRNYNGQFATTALGKPEPLDLGALPSVFSEDGPGEAQALWHNLVWNSGANDAIRAAAARDALHVADYMNADVVPDSAEAESLIESAMDDDEFLLDTLHELGPFPEPQNKEWGVRLAGALYDRALMFQLAGEEEAYDKAPLHRCGDSTSAAFDPNCDGCANMALDIL